LYLLWLANLYAADDISEVGLPHTDDEVQPPVNPAPKSSQRPNGSFDGTSLPEKQKPEVEIGSPEEPSVSLKVAACESHLG
jgi:hypothetical protein